MRWRTPEFCAAVIAASLSFLACLQGLQRLGSFFRPLSWKNACSPEVHMKFSPQSTHLILRSGCSTSELVFKSPTWSCSSMFALPGVVLIRPRLAGHLADFLLL